MAVKKKSKRLEPIRHLAGNREQQAAQQLAGAQRHLQACAKRLDELREYRQQYSDNFRSSGATGINGARLNAYQAFLQQLDTAIAQQQQLLRNAELECQQQREHWQQRYTRSNILDKTIKRYVAQEQKQTAQQEQRQADEFTTTRHKGDSTK